MLFGGVTVINGSVIRHGLLSSQSILIFQGFHLVQLIHSRDIRNTFSALDNSAAFLGIRNDLPNISKLVYSSSITGQGFGINNLSILTTPEPNSIIGIFLIVVLGIGGVIQYKK